MKKVIENLKVVLSVLKYSLLMYFRDRTAIFFSLFVPILIMSIFGVLDFSAGSNIDLGVVDLAKNPQSQRMVQGLEKVETFKISKGEEPAEIEQLKDSNRDMVLVIPKGFGGPAGNQPTQIELFYDNSQNNQNLFIGQTIIEKMFDQISHQTLRMPNLFAIQTKGVSTTDLDFVDFLIPGIAAMSVMQMSILGVTGAIVSWRERGILKRLLATPISQGSIIFGQVTSRLTISVAQVAVLITLGILIFDLTVVGSLFNVFLLTVLGAIVFLSMGFALSGAASTQNTVMALANLIVMPQMFLSGVFFPRTGLPDWLFKVTNFFPLTYLADGMREVMIKGATLMEIRGDVLGLVAWVVILFVLATRSFRWES